MNQYIKDIIERRIKDLPTLPVVATRIFEVTNDPEATVEDLKEIISTDQVVTGRILRAVNSAYYGFPRQVDTLSKAIVILGFNNVRSLALSVSIMEMYTKKSATGFNYQELWKHAVGTAFCARALAKVFHPREMEKLFIAGLLHDIGLVAMNQCFPKDFVGVLRESLRSQRPIHAVEEEKFNFNHGDIGQFIADRWLLPKGLSQAIGMHHMPHKASEEDKAMVYAVHTADFVCKRFGFGDFGDNIMYDFKLAFRPALDMYGITEKGAEGEVDALLKKDIGEAAAFIDIFK
jgi:putative nucleotidyltransferase with HDIG domain